jgi:molybdopterin-guanine dinucleotide biosynthesis protein A
MGRPKAELEIRGQPILAYLWGRHAWPGPTLLVTAPGREHPPAYELFDREVTDPVAGLGPLRGIVTALQSAQTPLVLIATVDMPGVSFEQFEWLAEQIAHQSAATALMCSRCIDGETRIEPFPSIFRATAAQSLQDRLDARARSVFELVGSGGAVALPAPEWPPLVWSNLNNPADVERFDRSV